ASANYQASFRSSRLTSSETPIASGHHLVVSGLVFEDADGVMNVDFDPVTFFEGNSQNSDLGEYSLIVRNGQQVVAETSFTATSTSMSAIEQDFEKIRGSANFVDFQPSHFLTSSSSYLICAHGFVRRFCNVFWLSIF
ncbi:MAG: hypothetical protein R6W88_08340, partial [Desulfobacterales bacterium]